MIFHIASANDDGKYIAFLRKHISKDNNNREIDVRTNTQIIQTSIYVRKKLNNSIIEIARKLIFICQMFFISLSR